ncbi:hypothetical protein [Candidatus Enterococcus murrayae]|uniref:Uncharacterized protein n=1 Tax=Candidatus Enterococcus murrayae TaxID=2815321 RepID=A0ABS3HMR7_9ENTE|nr:hypothetical protein [Enterococcus sp. MJM16]MBO0454759.1 hypothetical protein [Enterococcus sp. MJM16]
MKTNRGVVFILFWLLLGFPVSSFAEEKSENALCSGTYFPNVTISSKQRQTTIPLKVTITSKHGKIVEQKQVGIDGRAFEYDKKANLKALSKEELAEMAEIHFWSLGDGRTLAIDEFKVETLDNVESRLTFYNFEKNVQKTVHAYKSGDEIHANKKYSQVQLQKYENLTGDSKERAWNIEYRTMFTYMILLLTICPTILVIVLIIFVYLQTQELNKIIHQKKSKRFFLLLLLPTAFSFGIEGSAQDYDLQEIYLTQEQATTLAEKNQLEAYLIEHSGIQEQLQDATVQIDLKELTTRLNQPREQFVETYHSRTLIVGDYENYIVHTIVFFSVLIVLPLFYFLNRRFKTNQE